MNHVSSDAQVAQVLHESLPDERVPRQEAAPRGGGQGALHEVLHTEFASLEEMRERLRTILDPEMPPIPLIDGRVAIPRLD